MANREEPTRVTREDIVTGLRALGVQAGDVILGHASLRHFGCLEGGPGMVIEALLEAVGEEGTLALPGFSFQLKELPAPVFDVRNTPVWASKLYEAFRTRAGVRRSHHVTHSVCALGARARELTGEHSKGPCGAESPFRKIVDWGGKIVLMGVSHNASTTFHAVEEQEGLFYVGYHYWEGATIVDEEGVSHPTDCCAHDMTRPYDFNRMDAALTRVGVQRQGAIGDAIVRVVEAKGMYELAVEAVRKDPTALLKMGEQYCLVAVPKGGELTAW